MCRNPPPNPVVMRLLINLLKKEYISAAFSFPIESSKAVKTAREGELCLTRAPSVHYYPPAISTYLPHHKVLLAWYQEIYLVETYLLLKYVHSPPQQWNVVYGNTNK